MMAGPQRSSDSGPRKQWDFDPALKAKLAESKVRDDPAAKVADIRRRMLWTFGIVAVIAVVVGVVVLVKVLTGSIKGLGERVHTFDAQGKEVVPEE
jgi:hypothetical protein